MDRNIGHPRPRPAALLLFMSLVSVAFCGGAVAQETLQLHPENPHYFLWRGEPTVLITSAEHYGAVLNLDFDYTKYLDALAKDKLNLTRTFTGGAYVEPQGAFNISRNTLAPAPGRYITPWARSDQEGYFGGGNKFDLTEWNADYFRRLRDFVGQASERAVVVEVNLFCPMYEEKQWQLSPFNIINNVNGVGDVERADVYSLANHGGLLPIQESMVRKIVEELAEFDNIYYEVTNEPYTRGVPSDWESHMVDVIQQAQQSHDHKKLISLNIANNSAKIEGPHPGVSIFNFHYATPPQAVTVNYHLDKVIGDNETGFRGNADVAYRSEAWDFMLAGGGLYNNLDYSFAVGYEDGTFAYPPTQPGGGNVGFRQQMRVLSEFLNGFDFIQMRPDDSVIRGGTPAGGTSRALVNPGHAYAIYLRRDASTGPFSVRWSGEIVPNATTEYTLHTFSNDGVRLWIDDQLLIDQWVDQSETEHTCKIKLQDQQPRRIKLEYFYNGGQGAAKLWWSREGLTPQAIPAANLRTSSGDAGLAAEYFRDRNLQTAWATRVDPTVDFSWGNRSPLERPNGRDQESLVLELPEGKYAAEWVDPVSGDIRDRVDLQHPGNTVNLPIPEFDDDLALRIHRL